MKVCENCGKPLADNVSHCPICGKECEVRKISIDEADFSFRNNVQHEDPNLPTQDDRVARIWAIIGLIAALFTSVFGGMVCTIIALDLCKDNRYKTYVQKNLIIIYVSFTIMAIQILIAIVSFVYKISGLN